MTWKYQPEQTLPAGPGDRDIQSPLISDKAQLSLVIVSDRREYNDVSLSTLIAIYWWDNNLHPLLMLVLGLGISSEFPNGKVIKHAVKGVLL